MSDQVRCSMREAEIGASSPIVMSSNESYAYIPSVLMQVDFSGEQGPHFPPHARQSTA